MDQQRLRNLVILQIKRLVPINFDKVIDEFTLNGGGKNRKSLLT